MNKKISISDLNDQWKDLLKSTEQLVIRQPESYRRLKLLCRQIVSDPLDISDYLDTTRELTHLLSCLDPDETGSIFLCFKDRLSVEDRWLPSFLRMECMDLMAHLKELDRWRMEQRGLKVIK